MTAKHEPTDQSREQVEAMAGYGIPQEDIGGVMGMDRKTLRKHYREEIDTGVTKANAKVAESLYNKALGDGSNSVTAAIFWLKTRARWKETGVPADQGRDNGITIQFIGAKKPDMLIEAGTVVEGEAIEVPEEIQFVNGH